MNLPNNFESIEKQASNKDESNNQITFKEMQERNVNLVDEVSIEYQKIKTTIVSYFTDLKQKILLKIDNVHQQMIFQLEQQQEYETSQVQNISIKYPRENILIDSETKQKQEQQNIHEIESSQKQSLHINPSNGLLDNIILETIDKINLFSLLNIIPSLKEKELDVSDKIKNQQIEGLAKCSYKFKSSKQNDELQQLSNDNKIKDITDEYKEIGKQIFKQRNPSNKYWNINQVKYLLSNPSNKCDQIHLNQLSCILSGIKNYVESFEMKGDISFDPISSKTDKSSSSKPFQPKGSLIKESKQFNKKNNSQYTLSENSNLVLQHLKRILYTPLELDLVKERLVKFPIFDDLDVQFRNQNILSQLSVEPSSNYLNSKELLKIETTQQNQIRITNTSTKTDWAQCYLSLNIQANQKYIVKLSLNNKYDYYPHFYFGLTNKKTRDSQHLIFQYMNYEETNGGNASKITKGKALHSGPIRLINTKNLEFRFHIEEKLFKVSSFPNYLNVAELNDINKVDPTIEYSFAIAINNPTDSVTIEEVMEVCEFDNRM